jgi:hypothetical protein
MYTIIATVQRLVEETYEVTLDAPDPAEALDLVYEHFTEFPNSEFDVKTRRRIEEVTKNTTVIDLDHKREEANDVGERVFEDDNDAG